MNIISVNEIIAQKTDTKDYACGTTAGLLLELFPVPQIQNLAPK